MAKKRKRHVRWDRVFLLAYILIVIIAFIYYSTCKIMSVIESRYKNEIIETKQEEPIKVPQFPTEFPVFIVPEFKQEFELPELPVEKEDELVDLGEFQLTGYCNCEICCGVWSGGPCYNGEMPEAEWTIAVDPDVIPLNSYVMINGHKYKACDTGSAILEKHIDIYCNSHEECYSDFCNGYAKVYLIKEAA